MGHLSDRISNSTKKKRNAAAAAAGMRVFIHELTDQRSRIDLNFYEYFIIVLFFPFHYFKVNQEKLCVLSTSAIPQVVTSSELSFYYDTDMSQSINSSFFHT